MTEPHRQHERPGADQRKRNRHNRDQDRADGAQEQEDHENNDRDGLTEGPNHIVDRGLDELAGVVGHVQFERRAASVFLMLSSFLRTPWTTVSGLPLGVG